MDRFARVYAWFLLVTSGIAALSRLAGAARMAQITSEKLQVVRSRRRHRLIGAAVLVASIALLPIYFWLAHGQSWMPVAAAVGALSGLEFIVNAARPEAASLGSQNFIFGLLFAVSTVLVYILLLR